MKGCTCTWVYTANSKAVYMAASSCPAMPHERFVEYGDD